MKDIKKIQNIEFLRILFTICICIHHFLYASGRNSEGYLAVEFFFILSGFLLVHTFNTQKTLATFIKSKIIRFVPLCFIVPLFYSFFVSNITFNGLFSNALFLPFPGLKYHPGYADTSWYITALFWVLLLYFYMTKYWHKETVCLLIAVITFFAYSICISTTWDRLARINIFLGTNLLLALGGIGIGYILGTYISNKPLHILPKRYMYTCLELTFLLFSVLGLFCKFIYPENPLYFVLSFAVLLYLFIIKKGGISQYLDKFQWSKISKYTLATYLGQDIIIVIFYRSFFLNNQLWIEERFPLTMLVVILACCAFGIYLYMVAEKPLGELLQKLLNGEYISKNKD